MGLTIRGAIPGLVAALLFAGCASYRAAPLPPPGSLAQAEPLDETRLRVEAQKLRHPLLRPLVLDLSRGVDPDQAAVLAVLLNPGLRAARDAHGEAEAQLVVAGLLPNPELNFEATHPSGPGGPFVDTASASLSLDVRALNRRRAERAAAEAELAGVDLGIAWQEWATAQDARLLAVRLAWLRERLATLHDEITFEAETEGTLERALAAGDVTLTQVSVQRVALEGARRTARELQRSEQETEASLLALFGRPAGLHITTPTPVAPAPRLEDVPAATCLEQRLDLAALREGYAAQEARVRLAVLQQFPSLSVGVTAQRNESDVRFLGGFVTLALPILDRGRAGVTLAEATRARLGREYEARGAEVRAEVAALDEQVRLLAGQLTAAQGAIEPLAMLEARLRDGAAHGDVDRLAHQEARSALLEQKLESAALAQALAEADVAREAACGGAAGKVGAP